MYIRTSEIIKIDSSSRNAGATTFTEWEQVFDNVCNLQVIFNLGKDVLVNTLILIIARLEVAKSFNCTKGDF